MNDLINLYKKESSEVFNSINTELIRKFVNYIIDAYENEQQIFICANGGGVSAVENFVVDMNMHPFVSEDKSSVTQIKRNKFNAISLCNSGGTLTGITNDLGFDYIYSEQIKFQAKNNDIFLGMSGSGTSRNVVMGIKSAKEMGLKTILITRNEKPDCLKYLDLLIPVTGNSNFPGQTGKNNNNFHFEDAIIKLTHIACGLLKRHVQG
tara:strand:+ start:2772 stop:3395 length:624 start_codon:yes stop_codon:yes gene_type:complete